MTTGPRYAIYFAPEDGTPLARLGTRWLEQEGPARYGPQTAEPRRYGFHATLKAPFRLANGYRAEHLATAAEALARRIPAFAAPPLRLTELNGFLALRPAAPSAALDALAEDCLRAFDRFRAPPTAAELAKRERAGLDPRQKELLARWGYPYVLDRYRFHMTLTSRLDAPSRAEIHHVLVPLTSEFEHDPLQVRSICLFEQPAADRPFTLTRRFALAG